MAEDVKVSKFSTRWKSVSKFFNEVKHELKKVIWPSKAQLTNNTMTVLLCCLVVGAMIWILDAGLAKASELVFTK